MTGKAATKPGLQPALLEVYLVVHDEQSTERGLVERDGRLNGAAGVVHERAGLQECDANLIDPYLAEVATEPGFERGAVATRNLVNNHEADGVPVALMPTARVPEPDDEQAERRG